MGQDLSCNVRSNEVSQELDVREVLIFFSNGMSDDIHLAALYGNINKVKELLNRGANIHARVRNGRQAIHLAASVGQLPVVKFLLNRGANIHARDNNDKQPIHWAAGQGHLPVVKELLNRGANIHARDRNGHNPIQHAAAFGHLPMVKELIRRGSNPKNLLNRPISRSVANYLKSLQKSVRTIERYKKASTLRRRAAFASSLSKYVTPQTRKNLPTNMIRKIINHVKAKNS